MNPGAALALASGQCDRIRLVFMVLRQAPTAICCAVLLGKGGAMANRCAPSQCSWQAAYRLAGQTFCICVFTLPTCAIWFIIGKGTLRSAEFDDVRWETDCRPAAMADVLRVHEWRYVLALQQARHPCLHAGL